MLAFLFGSLLCTHFIFMIIVCGEKIFKWNCSIVWKMSGLWDFYLTIFWRFFWFFFDWLGYFEPWGLNFELLSSGGWALGPWGSHEIESLSRLNPQKVLLITYAFSTWQFVQGFFFNPKTQIRSSLIEPKNNQKQNLRKICRKWWNFIHFLNFLLTLPFFEKCQKTIEIYLKTS